MKRKIKPNLFMQLLLIVVFCFTSCSDEKTQCETQLYMDHSSYEFFCYSLLIEESNLITKIEGWDEVGRNIFLHECLAGTKKKKECDKKSEFKPKLGDW